ncbi:1-phosphofructokinase family hexose kinase [Paenibacillus campi]|uniref:1-phosphofructokinase family hexose kinase n=1 Tax=Paenibacillus campi TaxID=3106031 RepID=UPI002AFE4C36|nr:1-phosphofructokinase family hexose kinase [Paenibacillus sp. SGZ-1009]
MITTVTLNTALDVIYQVPALRPNTVHRIEDAITLPGGKGVNAARIIRQLGEPVTAAGLIAGHNGRKLVSLLRQEQVGCRFTEADGETRLAITILDESRHTQTELIEQGAAVTAAQLDLLEQTVAELASCSSWVLFSGSLPQQCPPDVYVRLIEIARRNGACTALDSSGEALMHGMKATPYTVKPNEQEACEWAGIAPDSSNRQERLQQALTAMLDHGIELPVISLGAEGAIAAERSTGSFYRIRVPRLPIASALGSGDAMIAGMIVSASRGGGAQAMLRLGTACGSACALQPAAGWIDTDDITDIGNEIAIEKSPVA